ncbi:MAG: ATP synthase F1 subunit epsilon [Fusobacteriia bacterium 4572_132]|nr:MAG: ATP synthase F1 subunit epsilon [Fusobacteriia bacterium 4572_132]
MTNFNLEIVTPQKVILKEEATMVIARTIVGDIGILANHAPLVTELALGEMKIKHGDKEKDFFISGGFLEISKDKVLILADKAINAKDIDIEKEKEEKELYEAKLKKLSEDREIATTQQALKESLKKIELGSRRY